MITNCPRCHVSLTVETVVGDTVSCHQCGLSISTRELTGSRAAPEPTFATASYSDEADREEPPRTEAAGAAATRIGKFEVLDLVSEGGYGRVYKARDVHTHRLVALKVPRADRFSSSVAFEAFLHEARTAVRLEGLPNVVHVYEVDRQPDGVAYIAMKLIEGWTMHAFLSPKPEHVGSDRYATLEEFVGWLAQVAEALARAHALEIRHRDLKPSNILIERSTRTAWVGDFGLAVHEADQSRLGREISGTYAYMSPEQVRGENRQLDGRTDIWSLGVILYERLARRRPFDARSREEGFDKILNRPAVPPSQLAPAGEVPPELEAICLRCLERDPDARYSNMDAVARDLRHWLAGRSNTASSTTANSTMASSTTVNSTTSSTTIANAPMSTATNGSTDACATAPCAPTSVASRWWSWLAGAALVGLSFAGAAALRPPRDSNAGENRVEEEAAPRARTPDPGVLDLDGISRPGVLLELFAKPPRVFRWPDPSDEAVPSTETWRSPGEPYSLATTGAALMACGTTQSPFYRFSITFSQRTWTGRAGIFWGAQPFVATNGDKGWIVQTLAVKDRRDRERPEDRGLFLIREQMFFIRHEDDLIERHVQEFAEAPLGPIRGGMHRLAIETINGAVARVSWDDREFPALCDDAVRQLIAGASPDPHSPREFDARGALGVINSNCATDFTGALFRR